MATDREFGEVLRRLAAIEEKQDRMDFALAKMSGLQALLPYVAVVVTGLTGLGILLSK